MKTILLITGLLCFFFTTKSQVLINEFMASNVGVILDPDYQASSDWIEVYNAGSTTINLNGYAISDNISNPRKWMITTDVLLRSGEFLLIWADDMGTGLHASFKLSADGEEIALSDPSGKIIDSLSFGFQDPNISMGRITDGAEQWGFSNQPTPGKANASDSFEGILKSITDFSPLGGIFNQPVTLTLNNRFGGVVRYTTDGSEPREDSEVYQSPIAIDQHMVVRTRIYQPGRLPGPVATHSYFINTDGSIGSLPVVSIASAPANFWDPVIGIYVQSFKPEWEIPINIELFENDGSDRAGFNLPAGTKVNGLYSWQLPQKMLGIYFRKVYGAGKLEYPLFFDKQARVFDSFALRASGSDWASTLFRDGMIQHATQPSMDVETQGFRACVVFINGKYMGIHNMRSKQEEEYIVESNQLGDAKIDMIAYEEVVEAGDRIQYQEFEALYKQDLSVQANFDLVAEKMNMENFTDFIIAEIYSGNTSIDHNVMAWKPRDFGKWRWLLADLDRGFGNPANNLIPFYLNQSVYPFSNLMRNPGYERAFGLRLADLLFTTFNPNRMYQVIDKFAQNIEAEIPRHIERWTGTSSSYGNPIPSVSYWQGKVQNSKNFAAQRPAFLLNNLKNYGFDTISPLSVSTQPFESGKITFNGELLSVDHCTGKYPAGAEITLQAQALGGYTFMAWELAATTFLIASEESWKYNDSGTDLSNSWKELAFDDASWLEGQAELGYGDGDENTTVSDGAIDGRRSITTYFRKKFTVVNASSLSELALALKFDDGAVVYLNGQEVIRTHMPSGDITFATGATGAIAGDEESSFSDFSLDASLLTEGENSIAVEIHQNSPSSTDISFDLQLTAVKSGETTQLSSENTYQFTMKEGAHIVAVFERNDFCVVPPVVTENLTLQKGCSPYLVKGDVVIRPGVILTVEPGVEIWMADGANMLVNGALVTNGTIEEAVRLMANPNSDLKKWGAILIENTTAVSLLNNTIVEGASQGPNPLRNVAAISLFHSTAKIDRLRIENVWHNPVAARYSDVTISNSFLHSSVTGDLINFKYGKGVVENCELVGNNQPDTDAIDYDDISDGIIRNCLIRDFHGFNSDAIDLGEMAANILIDGVMVYNITDKGVSVGQQSSAVIRNSIFVNCNLGAGLKDSSKVWIDHCTFYGCATPVSSFEKNAGSAGANVRVTNSILSNSYEASFQWDDKSTMTFSNCLSDNDLLPSGNGNLFADPMFSDPGGFDFALKSNSPALIAGSTGNMGADPTTYQIAPMVELSAIGYSADGFVNAEFLFLHNPGSQAIDISGFQLTKGVSFTFPPKSVIEPGCKVIVTENAGAECWENIQTPLFQWESGRLADEGETIQLVHASGIIFDQLSYLPQNPWPLALASGQFIALKDMKLDNHFGSNWKPGSILDIRNTNLILAANELSIFPNPASGSITVSGLEAKTSHLMLYNMAGAKMGEYPTNGANYLQINLQQLSKGLYVLRCGSQSLKVVKN